MISEIVISLIIRLIQYTSEDLKDIENCFSRILYIFETSERKLKYEEIIKTIKMSTL